MLASTSCSVGLLWLACWQIAKATVGTCVSVPLGVLAVLPFVAAKTGE
jgi:hypothetical protein